MFQPTAVPRCRMGGFWPIRPVFTAIRGVHGLEPYLYEGSIAGFFLLTQGHGRLRMRAKGQSTQSERGGRSGIHEAFGSCFDGGGGRVADGDGLPENGTRPFP